MIFLKSGLLWVVILLDWVSNLTETTDHRVWGREELEVWGTEVGQPFFLSYACIPSWNDSVGWIRLFDETHWPAGRKFGFLVLGSVESKPWTKRHGLRHTCLFSVC